jgi:glutamate synthase domain-containing protein 1
VRAATLLAVQARVDDSESSKSVKEERLRVKEADAENARRECHSFERTFKPAYEEVRKRALRLRLAAEERCERQIARVLSRAERDVAAWRAVVKKEEKQEKDAEGKSPGKTETSAAAIASLADAESALRVIKRALDGCKSATEWSKSEIATISSGRDV